MFEGGYSTFCAVTASYGFNRRHSVSSACLGGGAHLEGRLFYSVRSGGLHIFCTSNSHMGRMGPGLEAEDYEKPGAARTSMFSHQPCHRPSTQVVSGLDHPGHRSICLPLAGVVICMKSYLILSANQVRGNKTLFAGLCRYMVCPHFPSTYLSGFNAALERCARCSELPARGAGIGWPCSLGDRAAGGQNFWPPRETASARPSQHSSHPKATLALRRPSRSQPVVGLCSTRTT